MPIYEFTCSKCQMQFELRCSFSDFEKPAWCPKCASPARRLVSSFACKTGSGIQAAEQPFRRDTIIQSELQVSSVLITPPPARVELLSPPVKKSVRAKTRKKNRKGV
jgi:putative FmdB family regulatory protein